MYYSKKKGGGGSYQYLFKIINCKLLHIMLIKKKIFAILIFEVFDKVLD